MCKIIFLFVTKFGNFESEKWTSVPTLLILNSIKIDVYSREHLPPHFHALYGEHEILIIIKTMKTYAGSLPRRQHQTVLEWARKSASGKF